MSESVALKSLDMRSYTILPGFSWLVHKWLLEVTEISRELVEASRAAGVP
jgi:hypothetical protein